MLPEAGPVVVAGLTLERAQKLIQDALTPQFRNARVEVTITRFRTVRIYVVGDVQRPGAYDVSSLSTPMNALYAAGGPTAIGSLRILRHFRSKQLVGEVDLYYFLLHGMQGLRGVSAGRYIVRAAALTVEVRFLLASMPSAESWAGYLAGRPCRRQHPQLL